MSYQVVQLYSRTLLYCITEQYSTVKYRQSSYSVEDGDELRLIIFDPLLL